MTDELTHHRLPRDRLQPPEPRRPAPLRVRREQRARTTGLSAHTLASAIAAGLAQGQEVADAVQRAHHYVLRAIATAPGWGAVRGPLGDGGQAERWELNPAPHQTLVAAIFVAEFPFEISLLPHDYSKLHDQQNRNEQCQHPDIVSKHRNCDVKKCQRHISGVAGEPVRASASRMQRARSRA